MMNFVFQEVSAKACGTCHRDDEVGVFRVYLAPDQKAWTDVTICVECVLHQLEELSAAVEKIKG